MFRFFISIFSILVGLTMAFIPASPSSGMQFYLIVPIVFGVLVAVSKPIEYYTSKTSVFILLSVALIRYVITPLFLCFAGYKYSTIGIITANHYQNAVFLQIYEMIMFFVCLSFVCRKYFSGQIDEKPPKVFRFSILYVFIVLLGFLIIIVEPRVTERQHLIFKLSEELDSFSVIVESQLLTLFTQVFVYARYLIILLLINYWYKKSLQTGSSRFLLYSFCIVIINSLFSTDMSRFGILIPFMTFMALLIKLYPNKKKALFSFGAGSILLSLFAVSVVKFFGEGRGSIENSSDIVWWADILNQYFMGIKDTAFGISAYPSIQSANQGWGIISFANDCIGNMMGLSHFSEKPLLSLYIFNYIYSAGYSQCNILPNVCAGLYYGGYFLSPIITILFTILSVKFESISERVDRIDIKFISILAMISCSFCMMMYYTMIISNLFNVVLPLFLFYLLSSFLHV